MSDASPGDASPLLVERRGDVEWVTLNRPARLNTLTEELAGELRDYFQAQCRAPTCRVIVLRGAAPNFCAGFDLVNVDKILGSNASTLRTQKSYSEIIVAMRRCPQPIIALLQGAATGAGFAFALASDVRIAAPETKMNVAMARVGLTGCDVGISYFLPRVVGLSHASEMMMTGRFCNAQKALAIGLVSEVTADLDSAGQKLSEDMLRLSPIGLRLTKEGLNVAVDAPSLETALAFEDRGQALAMGMTMREGMTAFLEKRPPRYSDE